jgi:U3 small nucleolar RNA-associated protein 11
MSASAVLVCVRRSTQANKYTQEELLLMKTQDVKYLDTKSRSEAAVRTGRLL